MTANEKEFIRPMGPLQRGDQAIIDALHQLPVEEGSKIYKAPGEAIVVDYVSHRETIPELPKDHWSVTSVETDNSGNPLSARPTLLTVSAKDIDLVLRGNDVPNGELRTEEDKPKALDRAKLHESKAEQEIKLFAAERIKKAAETIVRISRH